MKGHVDSTSYLRAIVDRTDGIRPENAVLSNLTIAQMPSLPGLIGATDNGIIPAPDLAAKRQILLNARALYRGLGIDPIKVAVVAATEKVSAKQPSTADAASLAQEFGQDKHAGMIVDGPFGYDAAVSVDAAIAKKLQSSPVAGKADLLLFPTIEAANAVAKSWKFHGSAETGSVVAGATGPVMLNSRSDGARQRVNSLLNALV
jgi:phosphate butyryltransferase